MKHLTLLSAFTFVITLLLVSTIVLPTSPSYAQEVLEFELIEDATESATLSADIATESATASPSARVEEKIQEKTETDITETRGAVKGRLAQFLDQNPIGPLSPTNFVQHAIRRAVDQGVPANMLVLMLMFPVVASVIAVSRHIIGLQGFGVYIPAVLSVAFLSTGIATGLFLFVAIIVSAIIAKFLFDRLKLQYLPRTALVLWFVSVMIFVLLLVSPYFVSIFNLAAVGIFPILVLILLSENFISSQLSVSQSRVLELTFETLILAIGSALLMNMNVVQEFVILHPEVTILFVLVLDVVIGKYTGLRLAEYFRFKPIIDEEE